MDKTNEKTPVGFFAQIPPELKVRFDAARANGTNGGISQSDALISILEFALPFVESVVPSRFVFREVSKGKK